MITSVLLLILGFGLPYGYFYLKKNPQFGGKLESEEKKTLSSSVQWKDGKFQNLTKTTMEMGIGSLPGFFKDRRESKDIRDPKRNIEVLPFDLNKFSKDQKPKFTWFGHSVLLIQINDMNLLIDPMFGDDASPIGPFRTKRYSKDSLEIIDSLPDIDIVLLTHDHYDHLDFHSIRLLKSKVDTFLVPLGVRRHLVHWGVPKTAVTEFDWWDDFKLSGLDFVFTPSRHFSGRGAFDRAKSLWGGWVIKSKDFRVYWSGDGGYGDHFKLVGDAFGPFDWGFMECGQYNWRWHQIHMYPEESIQAAIDSGVKKAIPVHWGAFSLALHSWTDPIDRFVLEAKNTKQEYLSPEPGEIVISGQEKTTNWWEKYR